MKTLMMMLALMLAFGVCSVATAADTGGGTWDWGWINNDPNAKHTHEYDEMESPWGVGVDLDLYDNEYVTVAAEGRYDFNNKVNSAYVVTKPKIVVWDLVTGLFR